MADTKKEEAAAVLAAPAAEADTPAPPEPTTEFGRRNPHLAAFVPDALENFVDALLPDQVEAVLNRSAERTWTKYHTFKTDVEEGIGEVAGVLWRVVKYAAEKFRVHDIVFGVYHTALHHATVDAVDRVTGTPLQDAGRIAFLLAATDAAAAAYCPTKKELAAAAHVTEADVLIFEPQTTTTRPAYAVWVDDASRRLVWGFRGTTDLNDMLTDACASCVPYDGGYAHWGMLAAAQWFVDNELDNVLTLLAGDRCKGYELLLVGHSLGAGTAAMVAHMLKNDPAASAKAQGVRFSAVGIACPAVLTDALAEGCSGYVTSVVLQHDIVPRFSIKNVFQLKDEMDATQWGDILAGTMKDWIVPDAIENSATFKKLTSSAGETARSAGGVLARAWLGLTSAAVTGLTAAGVVNKDKRAKAAAAGGAAGGGGGAAQTPASAADAAAATAETARAAVHDPRVVAEAVQGVAQQVQQTAAEDVHAVFAPGRLVFIRRLDAHKGRAKYGNIEHRCVLCDSDDALPKPCPEAPKEQPAEQAQPAYELIEAAPGQRFSRIVLRDTCLVDHLCGGYISGLQHALEAARTRKAGASAAAAATPAAAGTASK